MMVNFPSSYSISVLYDLIKENSEYFALQSLQEDKNDNINITIKLRLYNLNSLDEIRNGIKKSFPDSEFTFYSSPNL